MPNYTKPSIVVFRRRNLTVSATKPNSLSTATTEQRYDERPQWTTLSVEQ